MAKNIKQFADALFPYVESSLEAGGLQMVGKQRFRNIVGSEHRRLFGRRAFRNLSHKDQSLLALASGESAQYEVL